MKTNIIPIVKDIKGISKENLLRVHLYLIMVERGIHEEFSHRELSILVQLFLFGGISSTKDFDEFTKVCFEKGLIKKLSQQSIRNVFTIARSFKLVKRPTKTNWFIPTDVIPNSDGYMVLKYVITDWQ